MVNVRNVCIVNIFLSNIVELIEPYARFCWISSFEMFLITFGLTIAKHLANGHPELVHYQMLLMFATIEFFNIIEFWF